MVDRDHDQALRVILLDHLLETVQGALNFTDIVDESALRDDGIKLIDKIYALRAAGQIEDFP